jgi:hypothetical protein
MAEKKIYMGSVGPSLFEDDELIDDEDGEFSGELRHAIVTNRQMLITEAPSSNDELMRLGDSNERILAPLAVANIADPSIELGAVAGTAGVIILVYQVDAATDEATLYEWEAANSGGADIPYVVVGSSGFWVAVAGKYGSGDHNDLKNIQGGAVDDYYHLLSAEYAELSEWLDDVTLGSNGLTSVPEVILVPRASALSDAVGGMYFSSIDNAIYVCIEN